MPGYQSRHFYMNFKTANLVNHIGQIMQDAKKLQQEALAEIAKASTIEELENIRIAFLGRKGKLTEILKSLAHLSPAEKPKIGQLVNLIKRDISTQL